MGTLTASELYSDWEGTAAADNAEHGVAVIDILLKRDLMNENDFLVGLDIFLGENHGIKIQKPHISALIFKKLDDYDTVKTALEVSFDPLRLRKVDFDLTPAEFVTLFKRLNITLTPRGLELQGRKYTVE